MDMTGSQISDVVWLSSVGRAYVSFDTLSVDHLVNVVRCDTSLDFSRRDIQNLSSQAANLSHTCLLLFVQTSNTMPCSECVVGVASLSLRVVWMFY